MDATNVLLNVIASHYFSNFRCIQVICSWDTQVTLKVKIPVVIDFLDEDHQYSLSICDAFVVAVANPVEIFERLELKVRRQHMQKYFRRRYLFFANRTDLQEFARSSYLEGVFDLVTISSNDFIGIKDLYYFIWVNNSGLPVLADKWNLNNQSFAIKADLYPKKMKGRIFCVGAFDTPPYALLDSTDGIELKLLAEFCNHQKLILKVFDFGDNNWGNIWANWTGRGILGCLLNYTCHAGIGGFYFQAIKPLYLDYIMPVVKVGTNCLVPVPSLETSLMIAFMPFLKETWMFIATSLAIFVISWKMSTNSNNVKTFDILWIVLTIFLQQSAGLSRKEKKMYRVIRLLCFILLLTLAVGVSYPSKLYTQITHPKYSEPIHSIYDLDKSGIKWGAPSKSYVNMINNEKYQQLFSKFVEANEEILLQLLKKGDFALVIEHLNSGYITPSSSEVDLSELMAMKHNMFWIYGAIYLQMNSVWQPSLQKHLLKVCAGGLQKFWESQVFHTMGMNALQDRIKRDFLLSEALCPYGKYVGCF